MSIEDKVQKAEYELAKRKQENKPISKRKKLAIYTAAAFVGGIAFGFAGFKIGDRLVFNESAIRDAIEMGESYRIVTMFLSILKYYLTPGFIIGSVGGYLSARKYIKKKLKNKNVNRRKY